VSGAWGEAPIAIVGGGQLGRLLAMAARTLGWSVRVLDPDPACPASRVVDRLVTARLDDVGAVAELARGASVVTYEIESAGVDALLEAERHAPVRPRPPALAIVQDRAAQKAWLVRGGYPVGPHAVVRHGGELDAALDALGPSFVKRCRGGYDGRGQARVRDLADRPAAHALLEGSACVVEQALDLEAEISILVARSARGEIAVYPAALNQHHDGVLAWSLLPAPLPAALLDEAAEIARGIAVGLGVEGLLTVELFVAKGGRLFVNELAPRPHNTFHATEAACATSQFEQGIRAVLGLPLGSTEIVRPAAIANLLGDLWAAGLPPFAEALAVSGVRLHLYEKRSARPGRKMGHLLASGATSDEALSRVQAALGRLRASP
jgi:5-(carboxyamino)imidazole ribonucleotide synthase